MGAEGAKPVSVYKTNMNCEACAKEVRRAIRALPGVETVKTDYEANKVTVIGKIDPAKVKARLEEKTKKKVEIVSPQSRKLVEKKPPKGKVVELQVKNVVEVQVKTVQVKTVQVKKVVAVQVKRVAVYKA